MENARGGPGADPTLFSFYLFDLGREGALARSFKFMMSVVPCVCVSNSIFAEKHVTENMSPNVIVVLF